MGGTLPSLSGKSLDIEVDESVSVFTAVRKIATLANSLQANDNGIFETSEGYIVWLHKIGEIGEWMSLRDI